MLKQFFDIEQNIEESRRQKIKSKMKFFINMPEGRWQFHKKANHRCNKAYNYNNDFCSGGKSEFHKRSLKNLMFLKSNFIDDNTNVYPQ